MGLPKEKVNPSQLSLAIEESPPKVRAWGLREAHSMPLVGVRDDGGAGRIVRTLRTAQAQAWGFPRCWLSSKRFRLLRPCRGCGLARQAPKRYGGRSFAPAELGVYYNRRNQPRPRLSIPWLIPFLNIQNLIRLRFSTLPTY